MFVLVQTVFVLDVKSATGAQTGNDPLTPVRVRFADVHKLFRCPAVAFNATFILVHCPIENMIEQFA